MPLINCLDFFRVVRHSHTISGALGVVTAGLAALLIATTVVAQTPFAVPANARSGRIKVQQFPVVTLDGIDYRLAPGARIYNTDHRTITPNLVPQDAAVKFAVNRDGQIQTIWLVQPNAVTTTTNPVPTPLPAPPAPSETPPPPVAGSSNP